MKVGVGNYCSVCLCRVCRYAVCDLGRVSLFLSILQGCLVGRSWTGYGGDLFIKAHQEVGDGCKFVLKLHLGSEVLKLVNVVLESIVGSSVFIFAWFLEKSRYVAACFHLGVKGVKVLVIVCYAKATLSGVTWVVLGSGQVAQSEYKVFSEGGAHEEMLCPQGQGSGFQWWDQGIGYPLREVLTERRYILRIRI